jgi:hypothetical protein
MTAPAGCQLIDRWRIVEADLWDHGYLDLGGPATITIGADNRGEIAFGALESGLGLRYGPSMVFFTWVGFDEMDEVTGDGFAELLVAGSVEITFTYHNVDEPSSSQTGAFFNILLEVSFYSRQQVEHGPGGVENIGAGTKNGGNAVVVQILIVLARHDAANHYHNILGALRLERFDELRRQRPVAGGQRRHAHHMNLRPDREIGGFLRCLKQGPGCHFETDVAEGGSDDLGATVMAVLAELCDQQARRVAELGREFLQPGNQRLVFRRARIGRPVDLAHDLGYCGMIAEGAA